MRKLKNSISFLMILVLALSLLGTGAFADGENVFNVENYIVSSTADTSTGDNYNKTINGFANFATEAGAGRVWTDKSVTDNGGGSFTVQLSAMAQEYEYTASEVLQPSEDQAVDALFILDFSSSMVDNNMGNQTRMEAVVYAANVAISTIMSSNPKNRVMVYGFTTESSGCLGQDESLSAFPILALGSYEAKNEVATGVKEYLTYKSGDVAVASNLYKDGSTSTVSTKSYDVSGNTPTQYGIYTACTALASSAADDNDGILRTPFVMLLSDGEANYASTNWKGPITTDNSNSNSDAQIAAMTILTAAYQRDQLTTAYTTRNKNNGYDSTQYPEYAVSAKWYNLGIGEEDGSAANCDAFQILMNPKLLATATSSAAQSVKSSINNYATGTYATNYTYPTYVCLTNSSVTDLNNAFEKFGEEISTLSTTMIPPITNDTTSAEDSTAHITFTDVIGDGMEVDTSTLALVLDGTTYTATAGAGGAYTFSNSTTTLQSTATVSGNVVTWYLVAEELPTIEYANRYKPGNLSEDGYYYSPEQVKDGTLNGELKITPIRLSYKVKLAAGALDNVSSNTIYTNSYNGSATTTASFIPVENNTYYNGKTESSLAKADNKTNTAANVQSSKWVNGYYINTLGNNGSITKLCKVEIKADKDTAIAGEEVTYTVTVTNLTNNTLTGDISVALPTDALKAQDGQQTSWSAQSLTPGEKEFTIKTNVKDGAVAGTYNATVDLTSKGAKATDTDDSGLTVSSSYTGTVYTNLNNDQKAYTDITNNSQSMLYLINSDNKAYELIASATAAGEYSAKYLIPGTYDIYDNDNGTGDKLGELVIAENGTNSVTLDWYTVSFDLNNKNILDKSVATQTILSGSTAKEDPTAATIDAWDNDHTFAGWYDGNGTQFSFGNSITAKTELTAKWLTKAATLSYLPYAGNYIPEDNMQLPIENAKTVKLIPGDGKYSVVGDKSASISVNKNDEFTINIEKDTVYTVTLTKTPEGKLFMGWQSTLDNDGSVTLTAIYEDDVINKDGPTGGDEIPDKYEKTVTYKIENGTWDGKDSDPKSEIVVLTKDGKWSETGSAALNSTPATDKMEANSDYSNGAWNKTPPASVNYTDFDKDGNLTYTYSYNQNTYTGTVNTKLDDLLTNYTIIAGKATAKLSLSKDSESFSLSGSNGVYSANGLYAGEYKIVDGTTELGTLTVEENGANSATLDWYSVSFVDSSNVKGKVTAAPTQYVPSGKNATQPTARTVSGYTFDKWYTTDEYKTEFKFTANKYTIDAKTTVYGKWYQTSIPVKYAEFNDPDTDDIPDGFPTETSVNIANGKTVKVDLNGGKNYFWNGNMTTQETTIYTVKDESGYTLSDATPQDGYVFVGWKQTKDGDVIVLTAQYLEDKVGTTENFEDKNQGDGIPDIFQQKVTGDILGGYWAKDTTDTAQRVQYVTLKDKDGNWDKDGSVTYKIKSITMVPQENYKEDSGTWYDTANNTKTAEDNTITITKNKNNTLLYKYQPIGSFTEVGGENPNYTPGTEQPLNVPAGKKLIIDPNGGWYKQSQTETIIKDIETPDDITILDSDVTPPNGGKTFLGWLKSEPDDSTIKLTAIYADILYNVQVKTTVDGEPTNILNLDKLYIGQEPTSAIEMSGTDGVYSSGQKIANGTYNIYTNNTAEAEILGQVTVQGTDLLDVEYKWFTVTFNTQGGSDVDSQQVKEGSLANRPAKNPTKQYYSFDNWYTTKDGDTPFEFSTQITEPTTVFAQWLENDVTVNYNEFQGNKETKVPTGQPEARNIEKPSSWTVIVQPNSGTYDDGDQWINKTEEFNFPLETYETAATYSLVNPAAPNDQMFVGWIQDVDEDGHEITYTAVYLPDSAPQDNVPDMFQKHVIYEIKNGAWNSEQTDKTNREEYVTLKTGESWDVNGSGTLAFVPATHYGDTSHNRSTGAWNPDVEIGDTVSGTTLATYTYNFDLNQYDVTYPPYKDDSGTTKIGDGYNVYVNPNGGVYTGGVYQQDTGYSLVCEDAGDDFELPSTPVPTKTNATFAGYTASKEENDVILTAHWTLNGGYNEYQGPEKDPKADPEPYTAPEAKTFDVPAGSRYYIDPNGGTYDGHMDEYFVDVTDATDSISVGNPTPPDDPTSPGKKMLFVGWQRWTDNEGYIHLTAQYVKDTVGTDPTNPNMPDEVPDMYQKQITYFICNGTWSTTPGDNGEIVEYVTLKDGANWSKTGSGKINPPTGMMHDSNHNGDGTWSPALPTDPVYVVYGMDPATFTVDFTPNTYTVSYNDNVADEEITVPASEEKTYGKDLTLSDVKPVRTGYDFVCWNTAPDGSGDSYCDSEKKDSYLYSENEGATLYAQWEVHKNPIKDEDGNPIASEDIPYNTNITINPNGGTHVDNQGNTHDRSYSFTMPDGPLTIKKPTRTGFTFTGWTFYKDTNTGDVTLTANWESDKTITYDEFIDEKPQPTPDGVPEREPEQKQFTVPYQESVNIDPNGGDYLGHTGPFTMQITTDTTIGKPTAPANKVFVGWVKSGPDTNGWYTLTAQYGDDKDGDGIADCFEKIVTYAVVNGSWSNNETKNQVEYVPLYKAGKLDVTGEGTAHFPTGMKVLPGYEVLDEYWDNEPNPDNTLTLKMDDNGTYTYVFEVQGLHLIDFNEYQGDDENPKEKVEEVMEYQSLTIDPNGGRYHRSPKLTVYDPVTKNITVDDAEAPNGKEFTGWKETVDDDGNVTLTAMYKNVEKNPEPKPMPPHTGDSALSGLWLSLMAIGGLGLTALKLRKKEN